MTVEWAKGWVKRQKDLKMAVPRVIEPARSQGCQKETIQRWFDTWFREVVQEGILDSMVANFDETMVQPQLSKAVKVVGRRDQDSLVICSVPELPHITLGVTVFADGHFLDHLTIYPAKYVPQEIRGDNARQYKGYVFAGQESGWINKDIFADHCRKVIIPGFEEQRAKLQKIGQCNTTGVFLVDGHASRENAELIAEFKAHNIKFIVMPPHTSHLLQPLDLRVFGAFKASLSKHDSSLRNQTLPERRDALMKKAIASLHGAMAVRTILASWELAGLFPFDPSRALSHPCILFEKEETTLQIDPAGKKQTDRYLMGGKVLTNVSELESMRKVEAQRLARKQPKQNEFQEPRDALLHSCPELALPPLPKRRGRPPKRKQNENPRSNPLVPPQKISPPPTRPELEIDEAVVMEFNSDGELALCCHSQIAPLELETMAPPPMQVI